MIMIKFTIKVVKVEYGKGKGKVEFISAQIMTKCGENQKIIVAYVTTKNWTK